MHRVPLACVSGITGADLKRRIGQIMTAPIARKLGHGTRLLLLAAGVITVAAPILLGQMKGLRVVAAMKASTYAEARAVSFAARVAAPVELEPARPLNTLIVPTAVREFQPRVAINLAQAAAPPVPASSPLSQLLQINVTAALDEQARGSSLFPGTTASPRPVYSPEAKAAV